MADVDILTFGCRLNSVESEIMRRKAAESGLEDAVIVNTCAVTSESMRQARQAIRKARRARPGARILVTGCGAQVDPDRFAAMPEVDRVLGNEEKLEARNFLDDDGPRVRVNDIMSVRETAPHLIDGFEGRSRAFVQVQQGCDHRCTFCIIPYARGNSRSVPAGAVVDQVRRLVEAGYGEAVLTGVDITSWGQDLPRTPPLGRLCRQILAHVPELKRLRLSSIDAVEIDAELKRLLAEEERLMPHLHLSLQAGDDMILKRMKRRHSRADAVALCREIRDLRPDTVFGADLIAGFPTEDEAMFANSLALIADCDLTWLHVFPYSQRPGTPAARMPQVDPAVRKARAARLRAEGEAALARFLASRIGSRASVLVERPGLGRSEQFAPVRLDPRQPAGALVEARIAGADDGFLIAA